MPCENVTVDETVLLSLLLLSLSLLTHLSPIFHFYTLRNCEKTFGFLTHSVTVDNQKLKLVNHFQILSRNV